MIVDGTSALKFEYVDNIPWEKSPAFTHSGDTQAYLSAFKNVVDKVPTRDLKISFDDNVWDFSPYFHNVTGPDHKFIFTDLPSELAVYCKFFVLHKISGKTKISTIRARYSQFAGIIRNILARVPHNNFHLITTDDILFEVTRRNASASTAHNLYQAVYQVYKFLLKNYGMNLPVDLSVLDAASVREKKLDKLTDAKLPDIPTPYFDTILNKALSVMRDRKIESINDRMIAAGIVFLSQTGLRLGDFLVVTTNSLFSKKLSRSGYVTNYIHFAAKKPSKAHQPLLEFDIFSNSLATEAFEVMKDLRKQSPLSQGNNILFVLSKLNRSNALNAVPHQRHQFNAEYSRFMRKYLPVECTMEWEGISPCIYHHDPSGERKGTASPQTLYIPDTRQYRVHLCTALYNQGVPLVYIQKYMGHLSEQMMGYYARPKDTYQENIQYSEKVIREIVGDDTTPLGGNMLGQEIKENIQKFIADNGLNVYTNIEEVMSALGDRVIIRGKTGGVCIKTSLMPCSQDARTNEIMCAYDLCPNLFHFYYMADTSYMNFQTLKDTYNALVNAGKAKAAQKELAKIKDVLRRRLLPELKELDKELAKKGHDWIITRYPSLLEVIENRDEIRKEIEVWQVKS